MTDKECFKQALEDYEYMRKTFNGNNYQDCIEFCRIKDFDFFNLSDDLFDINMGTCCFTILNEDDIGVVSKKSIEVWNDSTNTCLGTFTIKQIRGKIEQ